MWSRNYGPWKDEPDLVDWCDLETGLECRIRRHPDMGHLCGYVSVPEGHPWHGSHYDHCHVDVHGGPTYSGGFDERGGWWVGFDCAHAGDRVPGYENETHELWGGGVYRDILYVMAECAGLAAQIDRAWPPLQRLAIGDRHGRD